MAQTSTTLSGAKSHVTDISGTDISFTSSGGTHTISSTSTELTGSGKLAVEILLQLQEPQTTTAPLQLSQ